MKQQATYPLTVALSISSMVGVIHTQDNRWIRIDPYEKQKNPTKDGEKSLKLPVKDGQCGVK